VTTDSTAALIKATKTMSAVPLKRPGQAARTHSQSDDPLKMNGWRCIFLITHPEAV
jgi:hypothetical protein